MYQSFCFIQAQNDIQVLDRGTRGALAQVVEAGNQQDPLFIAVYGNLQVVPAGESAGGEEAVFIGPFRETDQSASVIVI